MTLHIDFLCRDGSPLGVGLNTLWGTDPNQIGTGGAEYGLLTLCEGLANRGHHVRLYNDPRIPYNDLFEQLPTAAFDPSENRDVLIVFRSPNPRAVVAKGLKVWLSCDQVTIDDFAQFSHFMDKIVCISPRHVQYFKDTYNIQNAVWIDLPIRTKDFINDRCSVKRVPNQLLFSSVPERGLMNALRMWPKILDKVPDAHLYITSDYRLWGPGGDGGNIHHRLKWANQPNVSFLGAVPRPKLIDIELQSDALFYPSCLHPNSRVTLDMGISKRIQDVVIGDVIYDGDGLPSEVKQIHSKQVSEKLLDIKILGEEDRLKLTKEHKVLCVSKSDVYKWKLHHRYLSQYPNCGKVPYTLLCDWKQASELCVGDFLVSPTKFIEDMPNKFVIHPLDYVPTFVSSDAGKLYCNMARTSSNTVRRDGGIPTEIPITPDLGLLFGYFLAEGSASNESTVNFTFSSSERDWADDVVRIGKACFGLDGSIYDRGKYLVVTFSSKHLCKWFHDMFTTNPSSDRSIPEEFFGFGSDFLENLMVGYWRGDASVGKYGISISSVSESLARQSKCILEHFGMPVSIRYDKRINIWVLFVGSKYANIWRNKIQKKQDAFSETRSRDGSYRVEQSYGYLVPIKSIKEFDYSGPVYDLGLESEPHSFLASNVEVHNCYDELMCIAVAEAECIGCYPITSDTGSLPTTNLGTVVKYNADVASNDHEFVNALVSFLNDPDKELKRRNLIKYSVGRFSEEAVLNQWDQVIFNGLNR